MQEEINSLKQQVAELTKWKEEKTRQQISYPLDKNSIDVLSKYFLRIVSTFVQIGGIASRAFTYFFVQQDNYIASIAEDKSVIFTVNATTDILTVTGHAFQDDVPVYVFTSDTLPNPLSSITTYYVIATTGMTFKLTTVLGDLGAVVNITNTGTGTHYINYL